MATVKIEGLLAGAVVDTINLDRTEQTFATASVTSRTIQASRPIPGSDDALVTRVGRDATRISIRSVVTTLAAADKLRQIIAKIDTYDEVRLFINSDIRFYRLSPESTVTDNPGRRERGFHPITINAVSDDVFEQGAESTPQFTEDMTYATNGDKSGDTVLWYPSLAGVNHHVPDASGNGNDGTIFGGTIIDTPFGPGRRFDGNDDYVGSILALGTIKSIEFWFRAPNDVTSQKLLNMDGTDQIEVDGSDDITATSFPGTTIIYVDGVAATAVLDDTWHHVVITDTTGVSASTFQVARVGSDFGEIAMPSVKTLTSVLTPTDVLDKFNEEKALVDLDNNGNIFTQPTLIKITGVNEADNVDQQDTSTGSAYTLQTSINEGATHRQTFEVTKASLSKIQVDIASDGGQTMTMTIHDSNNLVMQVATLATGSNEKRSFDIPVRLTPGDTYHFHVTVPSGTTTLVADSNDHEDVFFKQFYSEPTRNPALYDDGDEDNKFIFGKESVDREQDFDDDTIGLVLNAANDWAAATFQPRSAKLRKLKIRAKKTSSPGNLRVQIFEYDTTNDATTGTALATSWLSTAEISTTKADVWVRIQTDSLDITKTYAAVFDDDDADGSNFYTLYAFTTTDLDDTDTGRTVNSTDGGSNWTESTTVKYVLVTYKPDTISCTIPDGGDIEIDGRDGTGDLTFLLVQGDGAKDIAATHAVGGADYETDNSQWAFIVTGDTITWKVNSQYPMRNAKISTMTISGDARIALLYSLDDVTYTLFRMIEETSGSAAVLTDIELPSATDNQNTIYIRAEGREEGIDQQQVVSSGAGAGFGESAATTFEAQSFRPTKPNLVQVKIKKGTNAGTGPAGGDTITVTIEGDSSNEPDGTPLDTDTLTGAAWNALAVGAEITFDLVATLVPETLYWINVGSDGAGGGNNPRVAYNPSTDLYTRGQNRRGNDGADTWNDNDFDQWFQTIQANDSDSKISDMRFQADVDNNGAIRPKIPSGTDNIWNQSADELGSGRAQVDLTYREQYHT